MPSRRSTVAIAAVAVLLSGALAHPGSASAASKTSEDITLAADQTALVRFQLTGEQQFTELLESGADLAARPRTTTDTVQADLVVTGAELAALEARGAKAVQLIPTVSAAAAKGKAQQRVAADTLQFLQSYW